MHTAKLTWKAINSGTETSGTLHYLIKVGVVAPQQDHMGGYRTGEHLYVLVNTDLLYYSL